MKTDENQLEEVIIPLGKALKDARLADSLSIEEVAENLNLSVSILIDLENELDTILEAKKYPTIYLRGYLNNYAKLLGITKLELFAEYKQLDSIQKQILKAPHLIIPQTKKGSKILPLSLLTVIVIMVVLFVFQKQVRNSVEAFNFVSEVTPLESTPIGEHKHLAIVQNEENSSASNKDASTTEIRKTALDVVKKKVELVSEEANVSESKVVATVFEQDVIFDKKVEPNQEKDKPVIEKQLDITQKVAPSLQKKSVVAAPVESKKSEQLVVETIPSKVIETTNPVIKKSTDDVAETVKSLNENVAVEPETQSLKLSFNAECWTEVFDAKGKRVAFGLYKEGRVLKLSGVAPFLLKLGDPSVVEIQYQDKIVEGEFAPGRSAKFSVPLS